jgi:hypothetical protein
VCTSKKGRALRIVQKRDHPTLFFEAVHTERAAYAFVCVVPQVALKVADLGHLTSSWPVHQRWVAALEEEFFQQVGLATCRQV